MAKIQDKLYNRIVEGKLLELSNEEISSLGLAKISDIPSLAPYMLKLEGARVWNIDSVYNEDNYIADMKYGDIVVDENDAVFIIYDISFDEEIHLESVYLIGMIASEPMTITYDSTEEQWISDNLEVGTKLYLHSFHLSSAPNAFDFKCLSTSGDAITTVNDLISFMDSNIYSVISTSKGLYYGYRKVGGGGQYFGFYIQTINENNSSLEFSETNDMLSWSITDTVTSL